jgi:predicted transcriptional regulator
MIDQDYRVKNTIFFQHSEDMLMQAVKQEALNTIGQLPEDTDMDEIMYRLYVLDKIRKGQEAIEQGKIISSEELKREIDSW